MVEGGVGGGGTALVSGGGRCWGGGGTALVSGGGRCGGGGEQH